MSGKPVVPGGATDQAMKAGGAALRLQLATLCSGHEVSVVLFALTSELTSLLLLCADSLPEGRLLADAICVTQHPAVTFVRRLTRDLREHRKPPTVLVRRGLHLLREQRTVVEHAAALGCRVLHPDQAYAEIRGLVGS